MFSLSVSLPLETIVVHLCPGESRSECCPLHSCTAPLLKQVNMAHKTGHLLS